MPACNIMFAKRQANVRNFGFLPSKNIVRRAREVLFNPALRKTFPLLAGVTNQ
ncbi:hypothetical protein [Raineya sp.]